MPLGVTKQSISGVHTGDRFSDYHSSYFMREARRMVKGHGKFSHYNIRVNSYGASLVAYWTRQEESGTLLGYESQAL